MQKVLLTLIFCLFGLTTMANAGSDHCGRLMPVRRVAGFFAEVQPVRSAVRRVAEVQPVRRVVRGVAEVQPVRRVVRRVAEVQPVRRVVRRVAEVQPVRRVARGLFGARDCGGRRVAPVRRVLSGGNCFGGVCR